MPREDRPLLLSPEDLRACMLQRAERLGEELFCCGHLTPDQEDVREIFADTLARKQQEQTAKMESGGLGEKLQELERLRRDGLISDSEFRRKRESLLDEF